MSNNLISIIIPTFNRANVIGSTLESIINQSFTNWECIVVDDLSSDSTENVVLKYSSLDARIQFHKRPISKEKGPSSCRNFGFEISKGDFIYFFDSDDILKSNALETYFNHFQYNTDAVVSKVEKIDSITKLFLGENKIESQNLIEDFYIHKVSFYVCGPMWRKSFLENQPQLFDESLSNFDDWDFNLRMLYANPNLIYLELPLVLYIQSPDSLKTEVKKGNRKEIDSAFKARFKHLQLLKNQNPENEHRFIKHIAQFYKKTLRQSLFLNNDVWSFYFKKTIALLFKLKEYKSIIKLILGVVSVKLFSKGYRFFE